MTYSIQAEYSDPSAAHERALVLKSAGAYRVIITPASRRKGDANLVEAFFRTQEERDRAVIERFAVRDNPISGSGWLWIGGALVLGAAAWWLTQKKSSTWNCRAGMRCTHFVKDNSWQAKNLLDNSLALYSTPPENLSTLTLEETAPDGSYHVYDLIKAAVPLPDFVP